MKHFSENQFMSDVSGIRWSQFLQQTDDIDIRVNNWSSLFSFIIEKLHRYRKYAFLRDIALGLVKISTV